MSNIRDEGEGSPLFHAQQKLKIKVGSYEMKRKQIGRGKEVYKRFFFIIQSYPLIPLDMNKQQHVKLAPEKRKKIT